MLSEKGVVEVKEVERVMAMPELRNRLRKGVEDVEERLAKIPAYQKLRDAIGSMPPLNALVDDSGMVILAPHNSGIMAEDQMRGLFRDVRKLLTKPSECQLDVADDKQLRFYYPHPDEVSALLDTLHITPVRNIMQEVERLRAEQERLTTLAVRLHPEGAEALSWQHRTGAGSDIIKRRSGGSGGGTAGGALG